MAKAKKAVAVKKAPPVKRTPATNNAKVTIEVVIRNETVSPITNVMRGGGMQMFDAPFDAPPPNFEFAFNTTGVTILNFLVGEHDVDLKGESRFFAPVLDPNPSPRIRVVVFARKDHPDGIGSLTLKYKGKDIPDSPLTLTFKNDGLGGFNERVKLIKP
ncbi:hypothetical protein GFS24_26710 [Chitinophaga sp. SYP-B3965]|uniref:hypothetical protein n=1 Tax=Chitinophaga sp. SYP-B3965 TaxID=2663120 RepID=UPI00129951E7|nr:hypothetical protein [Chitinophaga sp. SYP-B3965]MRG48732.1 hypothetical protein [Chitinophaga sp. SYP-B3965]